jgi:excisionase family DNA binding protein
MTDTARDYQTLTTHDTTGLEHLFEPALEVFQEEPLEEVEVSLEPLQEGVPLAEAAKLLGVHRRYALDLVHKGKLSGFKSPKGQWFINKNSITSRRLSIEPAQLVEPLQEGAIECLEVLQEDRQDGVEGDLEVLQDGSPNVANAVDGALIEKLISELQVKLDSRDHHLQAANYRIGYLEAQLEAERQQVKLLTDSQHKPGWWARFSSWFFKAQ